MSRTFRSESTKYFRAPKTQATKKAEERAVQELSDDGFLIPPRLSKRGNSTGQEIPDSYDDIKVSAYRETPECKRKQ